MNPLPGTPIVKADGQIAFPAAASQNHWWLLDFWDNSPSGGNLPPNLSGQLVAVANTIVGLEPGDGILYLPINVAYGTGPTNCVWFQFDVYFAPSGQVSWYIWDVNCPGTSLVDYHYTQLGVTYTVGDHYSFSIKTSGSNTVKFLVNDTSTGSSWSNSNWVWPVPSTKLLAVDTTFSPSSTVEGYTTNSTLTGVPSLQTRMGDGISTNRNYDSGVGVPLGIVTSRSSVGDSSHWLWGMSALACGPVGGADNLNCDGFSPTTIGLHWGESGYPLFCFGHYDVQQSTTGPNGNWTTINSQAPRGNTTDYVQNLKPGQTYWWREVDHGCLLSATSNVLQAAQPVATTLAYRAMSDTTYQFSWNNNANYTGLVAFNSYQLEESFNGGSYSPAQTIISASSMNATINGLSSDTNYSFYLITTDKCGTCSSSLTQSTSSNTVGFKTPRTLLTSANAQRTSADVNQSISFTCNAIGGVVPYNFSWDFGDGSTVVGQIVIHNYASPGPKNAVCTVTDNLHTNATGLPITINVSKELIVTLSANVGSVDVGQTATFASQVSGGSGGYSYIWPNLPLGCGSASSPSVTCQPTTAGSYTVYVNVTDSNSFSVLSFTLSLAVYADPSITASTISPNILDLGQSTTIVVLAGGGNGAFSYSYTGLPAGCTTTNDPSFACTPSTTGHYLLSVKVTDLNGFTVFSSPASITINPDPTATLSAIPYAFDVAQSVTLSISAGGGTGSFSYSYLSLPTGCASSDTPKLTCTPSQDGSYTIQTVATDQVGGTATSSITFRVNPDPRIVSFISSSVLDAGQKLTLVVSATAGTGTFTYSYTGMPLGCESSNISNFSCNPSVSGNFTVVVTVLDEAGWPTSSSTKFTVNADPKIATFTTSLSVIDAGQNILLAVSASGGTGQLSYSYTGLPQGCASSNAVTLPCTLTASGAYTFTVTVTDSIGGSASSSVVVKVDPIPSVATFSASHSSINLGQDLTFTVSINGGTEPFSYSYSGLPAGCQTMNSASLSCTPSAAGTFQIQVSVTDQFGKTSTSYLSVTVSPQTLFGLPLWVGYSIIAGIIVAAIALPISVLRSRKAKTQTKRSP